MNTPPLLQYILEKRHHQYRRPTGFSLAAEYAAKGLSPRERMTDRFCRMCAAQTPVLLPDERICFVRTTSDLPDIFTPEEWADIKTQHFIHEMGYLSNLCPDYEGVLRDGLLARREKADACSRRSIDALLELTDRYAALAEQTGDDALAEVLRRVPRYPARTLHEALQAIRILHFGLWLEGEYHNTIGRFDQFALPYLEADLAAGRLTEESALALVQDFFLSFNKDSDLYPGVQQGDNGQSMVLGGRKADGTDGFNKLSALCLQTSHSLHLIDPKINLRVSKQTPLEVFRLGSELTRAGLGFPQYSNDDVVIPSLEALGYAPADAANYTVAACWEFIIPGVGADIANIGALSFPKVIDKALHAAADDASFDDLLRLVKETIAAETTAIRKAIGDVWFVPAPLMDVMMGGVDIAAGAKYNNFGVHGTGAATAADSLAAIKAAVYEEKRLTLAELKQAVDADFAGFDELLAYLRWEAPKTGCDDDRADVWLCSLLGWFADALAGHTNCRGGVWRAGTGSAMFYLWHAQELGASPDGRRKGEAFGTNYSPGLFTRIGGPFSVIRSFTKPQLGRTINGGPLTLEFHHTMFADEECVTKVALLVQEFIRRGGHQLQLNVVSLEDMKDAQLHPECHRQLVVRVWGWSAYFVELDTSYQNHVMARQEYVV